MISLEKLQNSYNKQIQDKILDQADRVIKAHNEYKKEKEQFQVEFENKTRQYTKDLNYNKALVKNFYTDKKDKIDDVKAKYKAKRREIKEIARLDAKEAKQNYILSIEKLAANYQNLKNDILASAKLPLADLQIKIDENKKLRRNRKSLNDMRIQKIEFDNVHNVMDIKERYAKDVAICKRKIQLVKSFIKNKETDKVTGNNKILSLKNELVTLQEENKRILLKVKDGYEEALSKENSEYTLYLNDINGVIDVLEKEYNEKYAPLLVNATKEVEAFEKINDNNYSVLINNKKAAGKNVYKEKLDSINKQKKEDLYLANKEEKQEKSNISKLHTRQKYQEFCINKNGVIVDLTLKIRNYKKEQLCKEKANQAVVTQKYNAYRLVKSDANSEIIKLKKIARNYYKSLDNKQKAEYRECQKYCEDDYRVLRLIKLDEVEKKIFKHFNPAYVYIALPFLGAIFFTIMPFVFMLVASMFKLDFATLSNSQFVGFYNFKFIFTRDTEFQKAISNTIIYAAITMILLTVVTIAMAAWLAKDTKVHNLTQTMVFTPHIASLVSVSILWIAMLQPQGIVNQILSWFNIQGPAWLMNESTSLLSVSIVTVWKDIGYYVLIIISGLQSIPAYVYEAAKLDKSKRSHTFFKITIPLLAPTLSFVFITKFINSFKVFAPIELMTKGGPRGSSMVLSYWIYKAGRVAYNYGQAMSGAIILTAIIALGTFLSQRRLIKPVKYV